MAEKENDEIDLTELLVRIKNVLFKNKITITLLTLVGLLLGFGYYSLKPPVYESEVVVRAAILNQALIEVINDNLTQLIKENNHKALADRFNISVEFSGEIKSVEIRPADKLADKRLDYAFYVVKVESGSNDHWSELEQGVFYYLSNNPYVKRRIELKAKQYKDFIDKLDFEISQIDTLKKNLYKSQSLGKDNVIMMNPGEVYTALLELIQQKQRLEEDLAFNQAIEVVEDFDTYKRPVSPKLGISIAVGGLLGLFAGLLIAFGRQLVVYIKQYERTHS
ncbi:hypothetical protein JMN32_26285 [Fulvivirga sp. 29W222]|uniref:Polysaccharide chain length determinant N-terminal domain-containing protein n=2 Tax=Fulvivirga marina TaxID=2494733 RepID=A0A937G3P9_9BACT|nr:hypothetical protein [Fulvivirga marina]